MNKLGVWPSVATAAVLGNISHERFRQVEKWGEQHHRDGTGPAFRGQADRERYYTDHAAQNGHLTWRHILTEEFYEALAESDPVKLRAELVQVAAVAVAWVEDIDSRKYDNPTADAKAA
jgi:hypothetical protein